MKIEINLSDNYRMSIIKLLTVVSLYFNNVNLFEKMERKDILTFLDSFRKTETSDPLHRWISTYNIYLIHLSRFFKWLYYPEIDYKERPKPQCVLNIPQLTRKEKSIYKPSDLWTQEDDLLFMKYCPSKRDRCYHTVARDTSCRPQGPGGVRGLADTKVMLEEGLGNDFLNISFLYALDSAKYKTYLDKKK